MWARTSKAVGTLAVVVAAVAAFSGNLTTLYDNVKKLLGIASPSQEQLIRGGASSQIVLRDLEGRRINPYEVGALGEDHAVWFRVEGVAQKLGGKVSKCNGELKIYGRWLEHARDTNRWDLPYNFEDGPLQKKIHFEFSTERWEFSKLGMPKKALFRMACDNLITESHEIEMSGWVDPPPIYLPR